MWPQIIAGLTGIAGGFASANEAREANTVNRQINEDQLVYNREQAQLNRDFQERMSNTAWQRGVDDMRKAGINPMVAFSSGGASSPSGATASSGGLRGVERVPNVASSILTSALEIARTFAEINKSKATVINLGGQTEESYSRAFTNEYAARHYQMLNKLIEAELPSAKAKGFSDTNRMEAERKFPRSYGHMDAILRRLSGPLAGFGNTALSMYLGSKLPRLSRREP